MQARQPLLPFFGLTIFVLSFAPLAAAPPTLNYLFPAGATRGQTVAVTASGSFSAWPVKAWVDRDGIAVESDEAKGQLKFSVAPDAACGVYWIRLYDNEGATALRPFVVGTLPEVVESEPNDDPQKPQLLDGSAVANGKLAKSGDVDGYAIQLSKGESLVASMDANQTLGSPMDAVLQVCNSAGFVLDQNDDAGGLDPLIVFNVPADGTYIVRTFAFPTTPNSTIVFAGGDNFVYRLTITTGGFIDHTLPLSAAADSSTDVRLFGWNIADEARSLTVPAESSVESIVVYQPQLAGAVQLPIQSGPNIVANEVNSIENPQKIDLPAIVSGRIEAPDNADAFGVQAKKGQKLAVRVESRSLGFPLDALVQITDASGKVLNEVDDTSKLRDPSLTYSVPADGEYRVVIRDLNHNGGFRYVYRMTIEEETPDFQLTLAADNFVLTPGKPLEIPVTVERKAGFAGEIEITAVGLPDGVEAEPVKSLPKEESAKSVKLKLKTESGPAAASFRIVGNDSGTSSNRRTARYTIPSYPLTHREIWLTVQAAKTD